MSQHEMTNQEISIDEAIETLDRFVEHQEKDRVPSFEDFKLHNGTLQVQELSKLETTLACFMETVSRQKRLEKQLQKKKIQASLLQSVDAIQIALVKFSHSGEISHELEARLKAVALRYNNIVSRAKNKPQSALQRIKYFIYKAVGWIFDEELLQSSIHFPIPFHTRKYSTAFKGHTLKKVATLVGETGPLKQEIELFFAKAHTLLKQQNLPQNTLKEALKSIRSHPIKSSLSAEKLISLELPLSVLPGEELLMVGAFSRKQAISVPIKESFKIIAKAIQTGFPHPLQSTGFAFSELLLPTLLLRPYLAPSINSLLKQKQRIAEALLPGGLLNEKAKALLQLRKELFHTHDALFRPLQQAYSTALFQRPDICPSNIIACIDEPLSRVREKWIQGDLKSQEDIRAHFLQKEPFSQALLEIALLIYSEKVGYRPLPLTLFAKKILAITLHELKDFCYELENIPVDTKEMLAWMQTLHEKKVKLLQAKECADPLVADLERYYQLRAKVENKK